MKTAIILAAGVGSRLRPLTETMPKCCVPVGGLPLIRRVVGQLQAANPSMTIYVATGYLGHVVKQELASVGGDIRFVDNVDYASTNNMESCRLALEARQETGSSLILNADCAYSDEIVARMVAAEEGCIAADAGVYIEENMKIRLVDGYIRDISKAIAPGADVSTSVDLYSFTPAQLQALLSIMQGYHARGELNQWTEVAIADLVKDHEITSLDISGQAWIEIDNHDDLATANKMFSA